MDNKGKRRFWTIVFVLFLAAATVFFAMVKPLGHKSNPAPQADSITAPAQ